MVGILLKIGKQSENVGEEEVFGRFCIRDVTENPSGGLLRSPDIRPPENGFWGLGKGQKFSLGQNGGAAGPETCKKRP